MLPRKPLSLAPAAAMLLAFPSAAQEPELPSGRPLAFVQNRGQWPAGVAFCAQRGPMTAWFTADGCTLALERDAGKPQISANGLPMRSALREGVVLRHRLARGVLPRGEGLQASRVSFLLGSDPARHVRNVPSFASLRYAGAAPGIDVVVRDDRSGLLAYDLEVARGAALGRFMIEVEGADSLRLEANGDLVLATAAGEVRHSRPIAWQKGSNGARIPVHVEFRLLGGAAYGFAVSGGDEQRALIVDPVITYHGGSSRDLLYAVDRAADGTVVVAGETQSADFPVTPGAYQRVLRGTADAAISSFDLRLPPAQQLRWSTFLGGTGHEVAFAIQAGPGFVCVGGITDSSDFPAANPKPGAEDGFFAVLDRTGSSLLLGRYVGGSGFDFVSDLCLDSSLRVVAGGYTRSVDLSTTANALQRVNAGAADAFVQRWTLAGVLDYCTYLGSPFREGTIYAGWPQGPIELRKLRLAAHGTGDVTVVGLTVGTGFPTTSNAWSRTFQGASDLFASQLSIGGSATTLAYSTYFGAGPQDAGWDVPFAMDVDDQGRIVMAGTTWVPGSGFPTTTGAIQRTLQGLDDSFVSILDLRLPPSAQLVYSTLLGTAGYEGVIDADFDSRGFITFSGFTWGSTMPTTPGAFSRVLSGPNDVHFGRLRPANQGLADLIYSSFLGGSRNEAGGDIEIGPDGQVTLVGVTDSPDFPVAGGRQPMPGGGFDGFVAEIEMLPQGVTRLGTTSGHCRGGLIFEPERQPAASQPLVLLAGNAPRNAAGVALIGLPGNGIALGWPNLMLWVDPRSPWWALPVVADGLGSSVLTLPAPPFVSLGLAAQTFWLETSTCNGRLPLASSAGLGF